MKNGPPSSQSGPEAHLQNPAKSPDLLTKSGVIACFRLEIKPEIP